MRVMPTNITMNNARLVLDDENETLRIQNFISDVMPRDLGYLTKSL